MHRHHVTWLAATVGLGLLTASAAVVPAADAEGAPARAATHRQHHAPSHFTAGRVDNRWFPLKPGTKYVYRGSEDGDRTKDVLIATYRTRVVDGVTCRVVFDRVWFRYGEEWTLQDVSFTVAAGTTTALVGETGSGKTTLGYLAARLYDTSRGRITIGGVDIRDLSFQALSNLVGVVSQETYLFHESVR